MPSEIDFTSTSFHQRTVFQKAFRLLLRIIFSLLTKLDVEGYSNIPLKGPLIIAINHLHWIDIPLGILLIPRPVIIFSKKKWKRVFFSSWFMNLMGKAIYVEDDTNIKSMRQSIAILKSNGVLGIAPEGTRSKTGGLEAGNIGAIYLANRTSTPILPMVMYGQEKAKFYLKQFRRVPIHVRMGKPFVVSPNNNGKGDLEMQKEALMLILADMLPREYQGIYQKQIDQRHDQTSH